FYALALDGTKRQVDSLCSNIGQLLWSGIVDQERARTIRDHLMSPKLNSGWGIRTMAVGEGGFSPVAYHNGTVWPHDCSLIAAGLARYGYRKEAAEIIGNIFEASIAFRYRLPEVFAGFERTKTRFPVQYATACLPQAWAAGTPMLGIRTLLGLEPKGDKLTWAEKPVLPYWFGHLSVEGIRGRWGRANVTAQGDQEKVLTTRQIYETALARRASLGEEELAA
ncbi:MAG: amylo-alpha-1,6-glucosidase, partial [Terriglobales bacterium]